MKLKKYILITVFILYCNILYGAITADVIIAYPVPFNPNTKTLSVGTVSSLGAGYSIDVSIYDINGDLIIKKSTSGTKIMWNGRNKSGRVVKPGLYIIKVEVEKDSAISSDQSEFVKKIIRILVDY